MTLCMNCGKEIGDHSFQEAKECATVLAKEFGIARDKVELLIDKAKQLNECINEIVQHTKSL